MANRHLGIATQPRTTSDYVGVLTNEVTIDDWREIVTNAKEAAKSGDAQARTWLSQHLMGKPQGAPALNVIIDGQRSGSAPRVRGRLPDDFDESDRKS
jgi:hypothetical protein